MAWVVARLSGLLRCGQSTIAVVAQRGVGWPSGRQLLQADFAIAAGLIAWNPRHGIKAELHQYTACARTASTSDLRRRL